MNRIEQLFELWEKYRDVVIKAAMITLAAVTTTFVFLFQRPIMPVGWEGDLAAAASAISLVLVYVGLAVAKLDAERRKRVLWVAGAAMVIEMVYGTIYVAKLMYPTLLDGLTPEVALVLGWLHAAPFSILLFLVAQFVFHDPSRDAHILDQLKEALAKIEAQAAELLGLETRLNEATGDVQTLNQLRQNDAHGWQRQFDEMQRQYTELEGNYHAVVASNTDLQASNSALLLQVEALKAENEALLEASNSNTSNTNGHGNYTDRVTALLMGDPELTNAELVEMTGIPEATLKVIAARVRKRMKEGSVLN